METTMTVVTEAIKSVCATVSNTGDTYKMQADVNVQGGTIGSMENGTVKTLEGTEVANWANYGNLGVNFMQSLSATERLNVLQLINDFIEAVKSTKINAV